MTYYISPTGSNANAGTLASPWLTIAYAYAHSANNDTIQLAAGTYTTAFATGYVYLNTSGGRVIQGATSNPALYILDNGGVGSLIFMAGNFTWNYISFNNFTCYQPANGLPIFTAIFSSGLFTWNNCIFSNFILSSGTYYTTGGIICDSHGNIGASGASTYWLNNCSFYGIVRDATSTMISSFFLITSNQTPYTLNLLNCTFYIPNSTYAITRFLGVNNFGSPNGSANIKNCIISADSHTIAMGTLGSGTPIMTYTCTNNVTSPTSGTGNIVADPLFIDPANANFNLRPNSPCVDSGSL